MEFPALRIYWIINLHQRILFQWRKTGTHQCHINLPWLAWGSWFWIGIAARSKVHKHSGNAVETCGNSGADTGSDVWTSIITSYCQVHPKMILAHTIGCWSQAKDFMKLCTSMAWPWTCRNPVVVGGPLGKNAKKQNQVLDISLWNYILYDHPNTE